MNAGFVRSTVKITCDFRKAPLLGAKKISEHLWRKVQVFV